MHWPCVRRSLAPLLAALALVACGGGGGGGSAFDDSSSPPATADHRNGDYPVFAANGVEYLLSLDFDQRQWRMAGSGLDRSGSLVAGDGEFVLRAGDSTGAAGTATGRITLATDTVIGTFGFGGTTAAQLFIAPRVFVTSLGEIGGYYATFHAERPASHRPITAGVGQTRLRPGSSSDVACAPGGTLVTREGDAFLARTCDDQYRFRVARVGSTQVLVRAGTIGFYPGLVVGVHESAAFVPGSARVFFSESASPLVPGDGSVAPERVRIVSIGADGSTSTTEHPFDQVRTALSEDALAPVVPMRPPVRAYRSGADGLSPSIDAYATADLALFVQTGAFFGNATISSLAIGVPRR